MYRKRLFSKQIKINLTEEAHNRINILAKNANLTVSEFVRTLLNEKTINAPLPHNNKPKVIYRKINPKLLYEINKIGVNLNQIAKKLHTENILELSILLDIQKKINSLIKRKKYKK